MVYFISVHFFCVLYKNVVYLVLYDCLVSVAYCIVYLFFFFLKQKTAYEVRISDWSSDVCSSDLVLHFQIVVDAVARAFAAEARQFHAAERCEFGRDQTGVDADDAGLDLFRDAPDAAEIARIEIRRQTERRVVGHRDHLIFGLEAEHRGSEEHTSELQSLMRISYAVFCLKKKKYNRAKKK